MKDPESEWKIQEYSSSSSSSSKEDDDEDAVSIVKWTLKNGYGIGKRMIVTGIVISSAPLIVPPLVAFSSMGVVFSASFGFLFATYACTNNLLTILLPHPDHYVAVDDHCMLGFDDEYRQVDADAVDDDHGPKVEKSYYTDKEDNELLEDINHRVEIELNDDYEEKEVKGNEPLVENENEYKQEVNEDVKSKDESMVIEDDDDDDDADSLEEEQKVDEPLVENKIEHHHVNEDKMLKDKDRVEGDYFVSESGSLGDVKGVEITKPVTVKEIDTEKLVDSKNDEHVGEMLDVVILSQGNDENNYNSREVEELDLVAREVTKKDKRINIEKRNIESDEEVTRESMGTVETNGGDASKDGSEEDENLKTVKEPLNHDSNADSLEVENDEKKTNINLESVEVGNEEKEDASDKNVDVMARSPLKQAPLDTENAEDTSKAYKKMHSKEDDEKMWEKIRAMKRIVGYKAPSEATCIGELKALYVFTGIEPPASSEGDSDLDDNLNFLMAIIGVK